jgi:hypothetical protein
MLIFSEKIAPPPRRKQIFNDHTAEDAALKRREDDARWTKQIIEALAGIIRRG